MGDKRQISTKYFFLWNTDYLQEILKHTTNIYSAHYVTLTDLDARKIAVNKLD